MRVGGRRLASQTRIRTAAASKGQPQPHRAGTGRRLRSLGSVRYPFGYHQFGTLTECHKPSLPHHLPDMHARPAA